MKKKKINIIDIIIIAFVVLAIGVCGYLYLKKSDSSIKKGTLNAETITFDIEIQGLENDDLYDQLKSEIGKEVVFGAAKVDKGVLKDVKIKENKIITADIVNGKYLNVVNPDRKNLIVTVESTLNNTEMGYKGEETYIRVGSGMNIAGPGYVSSGYIIDMSPIHK